MPPDVRKGFAFPSSGFFFFLGCALEAEAQPQLQCPAKQKAVAFRHIRRQSRGLKPADTAVYSNLIALRGRTIHETHEAKKLVHPVSCNSWIVLAPSRSQ